MKKSEIVDSHLDMRQVLESYGVEFRHNRFRCPVHNGGDFNCAIGRNPKLFICPTNCGKTFNIIGLVMALENCDHAQAVNMIAQRFNIVELSSRELTTEEKRIWAEKKERERLEREQKQRDKEKHAREQRPIVIKKNQEYISSLTCTEKSHKYLMGRGISKALCDKYGVRDCRIKCFDHKAKTEWFENAIMIPYSRNADEYWCWRRSIESKEFRKTKAEFLGDEPLFNHSALNTVLMSRKVLFVTESPIDCLSAEQLYGTERAEYVSIGGSAVNTLLRALGDHNPIKIVGGFDNDDVGEKASRELEQMCKKRGIPYQRFVFDKDCKDINDYLKKKLSQSS